MFAHSGRASSEVWEWLQEYRENLVDDRVPEHRDTHASSCRRRNGGAVLRAANFGDLITADHKVLSDSCESRNNHRYAVVVQDLATQWIQAYPCKTKNSQETQRSLQKFLEPDRKPKVIYTAKDWTSANPVKISPGIIARLRHTDQKQMVLLKEQCA